MLTFGYSQTTSSIPWSMIPEMNDTLREKRSSFGINSFAFVCGFREIGAAISRDRGRLFHGIAGSHFAVAGRLIDGFMESGLMAEVKGFRDFPAHAFA